MSADEGRIVVGILYPRQWYGEGFDEEIRRLTDLDPRISVIVEPYSEPHERRTGGANVPPEPEILPSQHDALAAIEIALAIDLPTALPSLAPNLRWVQSVGAGVNHLQDKVAAAGARLTSNGGSNALGIAEFAFGRIIEHWKRFEDLRVHQVEHRWQAEFGRQLSGCTLGLIGFGPINQAVADRARAFGMPVQVVRRSAGPASGGIARFVGPEGLHEVLSTSDAIVAAVPETSASVGMMGAAEFTAMRPGSFFCNVGRGTLVDEAALVGALESGHLGGAAIDVARSEPLPADDPLWSAPRLRISAHCSSVPAAMFPGLHRVFRENIVRYLAGEPLASEVDLGALGHVG